jgi:hypothetical protein
MTAKASVARRVWRGLLAAVTSPEAVKQERSLAALIVGRVALALGSSAGLAALIEKIVHG